MLIAVNKKKSEKSPETAGSKDYFGKIKDNSRTFSDIIPPLHLQ